MTASRGSERVSATAARLPHSREAFTASPRSCVQAVSRLSAGSVPQCSSRRNGSSTARRIMTATSAHAATEPAATARETGSQNDTPWSRAPMKRTAPTASGRPVSIDKKTQLRAPEHRMIMLACCELKNRDDVLGLQVRQVLQDLLSRRSRRKEFQNVCDTDAQAADAGSSSTHCDVCCDPIHLAQHQLLHTISTLSIITHRCGLSPRRIPRNGDRHGVGSGEDGPLPPSRSAWLGRRGLRHPAGRGRSLAVHPTGDSGPGEGNRRSTSARRSLASRSATRSTAGSTSRSAPASRGPRGPSPPWPRSCAPAAGTTSSCSPCLDARRLSAGVRGHACSHVTRPGWRTHPGIASRRTRVPARPRRRVRLRPRRASRQSAPTAAGRRPTGPVARRRPGSPGR